jgi:hypothetical protein
MYDHLGSPPVIGGVGAAHQFSVLCCVVFLIRPVSCVPNVASVSGLLIPFLIAHSVFSNVYFLLGESLVSNMIKWIWLEHVFRCNGLKNDHSDKLLTQSSCYKLSAMPQDNAILQNASNIKLLRQIMYN